MDANKQEALDQIGYEIPACCGLCRFGQFPQNDWGTCDLHSYTHLKHSGPDRRLSVYRFGLCRGAGQFQPDPTKIAALGAFARFFRGD